MAIWMVIVGAGPVVLASMVVGVAIALMQGADPGSGDDADLRAEADCGVHRVQPDRVLHRRAILRVHTNASTPRSNTATAAKCRPSPPRRARRDRAQTSASRLASSPFFACSSCPVPSIMIDFGLAISIALSVLILMVSLWIQKPLEFSAFPTILLVATVPAAGAQHFDDPAHPVARQRRPDGGGLHHRRLRPTGDGRRLRHRHHRLSHPHHDQLSLSSPRARRASPKSAPASRSTRSPASRWRSTPICRRA